MKYEPIPVLSKTEIENAIRRDDPQELPYAVLSAALYSSDQEWAQDVCLRLAQHSHFNIRGNAILGFGHIARIHRNLDQPRIRPLIEQALFDPHAYVRGHAEDAADDIEHFLHWKICRSKSNC
ncbi:MAG TPA: hypothetical protein VFB79_12620 [Candidatus Angelobacter sp.]|nr:hypothetical protein [Candidatus Angelobacter sp.]